MAVRCFSLNVLAEITSTLASPRCAASRARYAVIMSGSTNSRRFCATTPTKRTLNSPMADFSISAAMARVWSSREITGERISRVKSSLAWIMVSRRSRSSATWSSTPSASAVSNRAVA